MRDDCAITSDGATIRMATDKSKLLTKEDLARNAKALGVPVAAIQAVLTVEAPRGGFQADGQVSILFERHKFSKLTGGRFDKSHPDLSNKVRGGYGKYSEQHGKLQRAVELDRDAALMATSWGKPQILGENFREAGCKTLQDFINQMHENEGSQLDLMAAFIKANPKRLKALQSLDWTEFARLYNGSAFRENAYHTKLAAAYRKHAQVLA